MSAQTIFDFAAGEVVPINKPQGWTSFDVVKKVRGIVKVKKVGHAGTLDPMATGLLILCTGKKTKEIQYHQDGEKTYTGTLLLGATTPSFDAETEPNNTYDTKHITPDAIRNATIRFIGKIMQRPPAYSALKLNGKRMYDLARKGQLTNDEVKPRQVYIRSFEITDIRMPEVDFKVVCGKGTYIRSLAHDFGRALNSGAHLTALCRTQIGEIGIDQAVTIEQLQQLVAWQQQKDHKP